MNFTVISLFPDLITGYLQAGLLAQARANALVNVDVLSPRAFAGDVHHTVDDRAFGGGDGMVMKVEPLKAAIETLPPATRVVVLSPQGRRWSQGEARSWARAQEPVALVCGRYAGIDQRFVHACADDEVSLGDFVLNGGELAALALIESVARLIPGVLGNAISSANDSFEADDGAVLECPQFTRPREVLGLGVPPTLLGGNHAEIAKFTRAVARARTAVRRPDLLPEVFSLNEDLKVLRTLPADELELLGININDLEFARQRWP